MKSLKSLLPLVGTAFLAGGVLADLSFQDAAAGLRYTYRVEPRVPYGDAAVITGVYKAGANFAGDVTIPDNIIGIPVAVLEGSASFWRVSILEVKRLSLPPTITDVPTNILERLTRLEHLEMPLWLAIETSKSGGTLASWHPISVTNNLLELVTGGDPHPTSDLPICAIPSMAFSLVHYIESITLPLTVQAIGDKAFSGCTYLKRVQLESDASDLSQEFYDEADAFWQRWLDEVVVQYNPTNTLRKVNPSAFNCRYLEEVDLPPAIERIDQGAFNGASSLRRIGMPAKLKVLGRNALAGLPSLEDVSFGTNLVMIGSGAFQSCRSLKHVKLPGSVVVASSSSIRYQGRLLVESYEGLYDSSAAAGQTAVQYQYYPSGLFANCISLETVELGGVWYASLPSSLFLNCTSLTNVVLPVTLQAMATPVFRGCTALNELVLPDTVRTVNTNAFIGCPNLSLLWLASGMTSIPANAFRGMSSLEVVAVSPTLRQIGASAFEDCTALHTILPAAGGNMNGGFSAISAIRDVILPSTVTSVGRRAFWGCTGVGHVSFPKGVGRLTEDVFEPDSRVSVDISPALRKTELFGDGKVRVLSAEMSETEPGKMIVRYEVVSSNATVHAYPVVFAGGGRSFANVVRPTALENAPVDIPANVEQTLAWDVGADLGVDFSGTLQFGFVSDAGTSGAGTTLDGLFWQYAKDAAGLSLSQGELRSGGTVLANGAAPTSDAAGYLLASGVPAASIIHGESKEVNVRLATHRFAKDIVLDGEVSQFFTVPGMADGAAFEGAVEPIVTDVNGDGLFDLIIATPGTTNVYLNVGTASSPEFRTDSPALAAGAAANLATLADYPAIEAALRNGGASTEGLSIAIVDWNDDGGTDAICGTASGRIMMLSDQSIGRPSGLAGEFSPTSVNLSWNPVAAPGVRGYRVYRSVGKGGEATCLEDPFTALPRISDSPPALGVDYWYRVSAVSRRYLAGNSEPEYVESDTCEPIYGMFGRVELMIPDVTVSTNGTAEVMLSIRNTMDLSGNGGSFTISYDPSLLAPLKANSTGKTGLSSAFQVTAGDPDAEVGEWTVTTKGGKCPAGGGAFLLLRFDVTTETAVTTTVAVTEASMTVAGNAGAEVDIMPVEGQVIILPPVPEAGQDGVPPYSPGDVDGNGLLDAADVRLLAKLKSAAGRKYTAAQLRAGDFNGNGKLDDADYQALRAKLKELGKL